MTENPTSRSQGISKQLNCVGSKYCTTTCSRAGTQTSAMLSITHLEQTPIHLAAMLLLSLLLYKSHT